MNKNTDSEIEPTTLELSAGESFTYPIFVTMSLVHLAALPTILTFSWVNFFGWMIAHYLFSTFGIALAYHRYFSHRSFRTDFIVFERFLALICTLCFQGGPLFWSSAHRAHHLFTEEFGDPHSASRGFWWSHVKWTLYSNPNGFSFIKSMRLVRDWRKDPVLMWLEVNNLKINLSFLLFLFVVCYVSGNPTLFFWVGPLRLVTVWHSTWLTNSFLHRARLKGGKPSSLRNSTFMSFLLGGEGDHEFHHRHPSSVRHSERRFHFDHAFHLLRVLKVLRIVNFREPPRQISSSHSESSGKSA